METCCAEMTQNKQIIAAAINEDRKWSSNKRGGEEGLNTVECLRGRLLAEREASRLAKEQAESIGNLLFELEKKLREEIKLRDRAERKLKFFKKKLESFNINISSISGESEQSEKCESSITLSTSSSASGDPESNETKPHITNAAVSENSEHNIPEASAPYIAKDSDSQETDNSSFGSNPSSGDMKNDESRVLSSKSSATDNEADDHDSFDNSRALVPVDLASTTQASDPKPIDESVIQVLDALRHARQKLLGSMDTRQIIKV